MRAAIRIGLLCLSLVGVLTPAAHAGQNVLTWTNPTPDNATSIEVWRKVEACAGPGLFGLADTLPSPVATYTDLGLTEGATYCYEVRGVNLAGASPFSNTASRTIPFTVPLAPSGLTVN